MKYVLPVASALALVALAGCSSMDPFSSGSDQASASPAAAPSPGPIAQNSANVTGDASAMAVVQSRNLKAAQRTLKAEGLYKGKIDGKSGPLTIAAIQSFQKRHGLQQTGWLDEDTWRALGPYEAQARRTGNSPQTR